MKSMSVLLSLLLVFTVIVPGPAAATILKGEVAEINRAVTSFQEWRMNETVSLTDSTNAVHQLTPTNITANSERNAVTLSFHYNPSPGTSAGLYFGLHTEEGGVATYDTNYIYLSSSPQEIQLELDGKYIQEEFFYIRLAMRKSLWDSTLSGEQFKKIPNPFFSGTAQPVKEDLVIVSNELLNGSTSQTTGNFSLDKVNEAASFTDELPNEAYKLDMLPEFNPDKADAKLVNPLQLKGAEGNNMMAAEVGAVKEFWAMDTRYGTSYKVTAVLKYAGTKSEVWVVGDQLSTSQSQAMGMEFDDVIYPLITQNFAAESDVDGNGKVELLVLDIQDGFSGSGGYVAGYFYSGDLYNTTYSNTGEVFYIDTYPSMGLNTSAIDPTKSYSTIAHEFQHMVNFNQNVLLEKEEPMDVWLNEALSMAAEHMYLNQPLTSRIKYYEQSSSIANGHSLLYWDRAGDVLSNYSLSYLFGQYLRIQARQGHAIYREILSNTAATEQALEQVIQTYIGAGKTLGEFLSDFRVSLYSNDASGLFGFEGETGFSTITSPLYAGGLPHELRGGGAIAVPIEDAHTFTAPADGGDAVVYRPLNLSSSSVPDPIDQPVVSVEPVSDKSAAVRGTTSPAAAVTVRKGTTVIGEGAADSAGLFDIPIPVHKADTILSVVAVGSNGVASEPVTVTVLDKTAPAAPMVNPMTGQSVSVDGTAEAASTVNVKKDGVLLGSAKAANDGSFSVAVPKQPEGTALTVTATDAAGNESEEAYTYVEDSTPPMKPIIGLVTDQSTKVEGEAEPHSSIVVYAGTREIGNGSTDSSGSFSIPIPKQQAGTVLTVRSYDMMWNSSEASVTIADETVPSMPEVRSLNESSAEVTGTAEAGSTITVRKDMTVIGTGKASDQGEFSILIPLQSPFTMLEVTATDAAGNESEPAIVYIEDSTPPIKPVINSVTDQSTKVEGEAEPHSSISVYVGTREIGSGSANNNGSFSVLISKQQAGTVLTVRSYDMMWNSSEATVTVTDGTAPAQPVVYPMTEQSVSVDGTADVSSIVKVTKAGVLLGSAKAASDGSFSVAVPKQSEGTVLSVTATDEAGHTSESRAVTVTDGTAPAKPVVNAIDDTDAEITGTAEPGSYILATTVKGNLYTTYAQDNGTFSMRPALMPKARTVITFTAKDKAGNVSESTSETVLDKTKPVFTHISRITDQSTAISGTTELFAKVTAVAGTQQFGPVPADQDGKFTIPITKLREGTKVILSVIDEAGNSGISGDQLVADGTPPVIFNVLSETHDFTLVVGKAEPYSRIEAWSGGLLLGTSTSSYDGSFRMEIPRQEIGSKITLIAIDSLNNKSNPLEVDVAEARVPKPPVVKGMSNVSWNLEGIAEPGMQVKAEMGGKPLGNSVKADAQGIFQIGVSSGSLRVGAKIKVVVVNKNGWQSEPTTITVLSYKLPYPTRIEGSDRYETAVAISKEGWSAAKTVVIATGADFPDALAGGPLAYKLDAPILLTRKDRLPEATITEIKRLGATNAVILGSKGAISEEVAANLKLLGLETERIGGKDRFETAALIAERLPSKKAVIAYGYNFPDVLSVSPYAARHGIPILLTKKDTLPAVVKEAIAAKDATIVVGSTGVVSNTVLNQLPSPKRYGGKTRYDTAAAIFYGLPMVDTVGYVVTGKNFPDALSGAVLAAKNYSPFFLVDPDKIPEPIRSMSYGTLYFEVIGSTGAVSKSVADEFHYISVNIP